jgi:hypothetical protein
MFGIRLFSCVLFADRGKPVILLYDGSVLDMYMRYDLMVYDPDYVPIGPRLGSAFDLLFERLGVQAGTMLIGIEKG